MIDAVEVLDAKKPIKIGRWIFEVDWSFLDWEPLSVALCADGTIALYPVRRVDLQVNTLIGRYEIIGIRRMLPTKHYLLLGNTGLKGKGWNGSLVER